MSFSAPPVARRPASVSAATVLVWLQVLVGFGFVVYGCLLFYGLSHEGRFAPDPADGSGIGAILAPFLVLAYFMPTTVLMTVLAVHLPRRSRAAFILTVTIEIIFALLGAVTLAATVALLFKDEPHPFTDFWSVPLALLPFAILVCLVRRQTRHYFA